MRRRPIITACCLVLLAVCVGCGDSETEPESNSDSSPTPYQPANDPNPQANANPNAGGQPPAAAKRDVEPMEKSKALQEMPGLVKTTPPGKPAVNPNDPIAVWFKAYTSARERPKQINFEHQLNITKNLPPNDGRSVSFDQFMSLAKQLDIAWEPLPPNQYYLYDPKTVTLEVYELPAEAGDDQNGQPES